MRTTTLRWEGASAIIPRQINADGVHVWPFEASFPIDVRFFVLDRSYNPRLNRHHYLELTYVYSGGVEVQIQSSRFQLNQEDMVIIGSDLFHRMIRLGRASAKTANLYFEPELLSGGNAIGEDADYLTPFYSQESDLCQVIKSHYNIHSDILKLMLRIRSELPVIDNRGRLSVKTYLRMILILLVNHYGAQLGMKEALDRRQEAIRRLQPCFDWMEQNHGQAISVSDAAHICAMSRSYFMYFFKRVTGQSFLSYLNNFRVARAEGLLASTRRPISEIGEEMGFCNQSYFGMVFRKLVGLTPLEYRKQFGCVPSESHGVNRQSTHLTPPVSSATFDIHPALPSASRIVGQP
ncbi:MAG TPA: AraC family transcriptional regulator [Anaerolineales bacterium]|nr:AraC family transcriptional regulator [Anaerolineales bacterium]